MNRSKSLLRRALAVAGAAAIGLVGSVALQAPASAHHSEVVGVPVCDTASGDWVVTWTVTTVAPKEAPNFRIVSVEHTPASSTLEGIAATQDPTQEETFPFTTGTPIVAKQKVAAGTEKAELFVKVKWNNLFEEEKPSSGEVKFHGTCQKDSPKPSVQSASDCAGTITITLTNGKEATAPAEFKVVGKGVSKTVVVAAGESETIKVPSSAGTVKVTVNGKQVGGDITWSPQNCEAPSLASKSDCDTLTIEVTNPKGGTPLTFTFTPGEGQTKTLDVAPGETKTVVYGGAKAKQVVVSAPGFENETVVWQKPGNCDTGGALPVTGMKIGGAVAGALVLLAAGGVLFMVARRRRVTFTA